MDGPQVSVRTDEGANALDVNQLVAMLAGRGVVSGGEVHDSPDVPPFGVQVMAANGWFADSEAAVGESEIDGDTTVGTAVQRLSATVDLREYVNETYPRKVLICLPREATGNAAGGAYHVVAGDPEQAKPADFDDPWETSEPALPDLDDEPELIPLAAIWVGANTEEIAEGDIWDRRQRPDAALRKLWANELHLASLTDPAGNTHTAGLADAADATTEAHREAINTDPLHGSRTDGEGAAHNYTTADMVRGYITGEVDVAELSGALGADGQLPFSTGSAVNWTTPPDEWGSLQALVDAAAAAGVTPSFPTAEIGDQTLTGSITWPDGTVTTSSPSAAAGNVALLADLGDVQRGDYADRHAPDGSGDIYFAETGATRGIYHDDPANATPAWSAVAIHPADIDAGDLGFDVATQGELDTHAGTADAHHTRYDEAVQDIESHADPLAIDITGDAATLDGLGSSQLARSDVDDNIAGIRTHKDPSQSIHGERSAGEVERWVGNTADRIFISNTTGGPIDSECFNAYHDGSEWRYQVSNASAWLIQAAGDGGLNVYTAPGSLSGEIIDWQGVSISGGSIDEADHATNASSLTGGPATWKTRNGYAVNGGHGDFTSAGDAIIFAHNNGYGRVEFPAGTYGRISHGSGIEGLVIAGSGNAKNAAHRTLFEASGNAIQMAGNGLTFENVAVESTDNGDGFSLDGNDCVIRDCCVVGAGREGIRIGGGNCHITGTRVFTVPNNRILLGGLENTVIGNQGVDGYIDDRGSGNVYAGLNS
jgi:hypothetical protein